jgi:CRP/FNR family transcriptional regulator, nitrogen fixation regulation protein
MPRMARKFSSDMNASHRPEPPAGVPGEHVTKALVDALPAMVAYWDKDLRCRFANKVYLQWFAKLPEAAIGSAMPDLIGERLFALNEPYIRAALAGTSQSFERSVTMPDGTTGHIWVNYVPNVDVGGEVVGFFVLLTDITPLRDAEATLDLATSVTGIAVKAQDLAANGWPSVSWMPQPPPAANHNVAEAGKGAVLLRLDADSRIYAEGDPATSFYKVLTGVMRTCKFLSDGRRQVDAFYGPGDVFGFEAGAQHRLTAEAVSDCLVTVYRRQDPEALKTADAELVQTLLAHAMQSLERARDHSLLLGRGSAAQKLAAFLLDMAERWPGKEVIELPMSRVDIADYLGLTIETVSRTLTQFERDQLIELSTVRRIHLKNRTALRHLNS